MAFDTITGAAASTATTFGGAALNKVANLLNGGGSEVATVYDDDIYIVDPADATKRIRFNADAITTGTDVVVSVKSDSAVNLGSVGTHEVYIPAGAMELQQMEHHTLQENWQQMTLWFLHLILIQQQQKKHSLIGQLLQIGMQALSVSNYIGQQQAVHQHKQ